MSSSNKEKIENLFSKDFKSKMDLFLPRVIKHIKDQKDSFEITIRGITDTDIENKIKDKNYKWNLNVIIYSNGIELPYLFDEYYDLIISSIPKTVEELIIPYDSIKDIKSFLSNFPNLKKVIINDKGFFTNDELEYLKNNTQIKFVASNGDYSIPNNMTFDKINNVGYCNDIKVYFNRYNYTPNDLNSFDVKCLNFNEEEFLRLYKSRGFLNFPSDFKLETSNLNLQLENKNGKNILNVKGQNIDEFLKIFDCLKSCGIDLDTINFENLLDKNIYEFDYNILNGLAESYDLSFHYLDYGMNFEELKGQIETINWYKSIILESDLSPIEKLTYAYDILKTYHYNESKTNRRESRYPHKIIDTDHIVCAGYTAMLDEILKGIDNNINFREFTTRNYNKDGKFISLHSRCAVRIDDDKYNIHGIYVLDPTWDSYDDKKKELYGDDYTALDSYKYFMVPILDYDKTFPTDSFINIFNNELYFSRDVEGFIDKDKIKKDIKSGIIGTYRLNINGYALVDGLEEHEIPKYLSSPKLSFEKFLEIVRNVRKAEGYPEEMLDSEMDKISRINSEFYENEYQKQK